MKSLCVAHSLVEGHAELWARRHEQYDGGEVREPVAGIHRCPTVNLDFGGLYPNIIITFNICPSTILRKPEPGSNISPLNFAFSSSSQGIIPRAIARVIKLRKNEQAKMKGETDPAKLAVLNARQRKYKEIAVALYGQFGNRRHKELCLLPAAVSITAWGRMYVNKVWEEIPPKFAHLGVEVGYGDTDSAFLLLRNVTGGEEGRDWGIKIAKWANDNLFPGTLRLEYESTSLYTAFKGKKQYMQVLLEDGKLKTKGIENRRRTPYCSRLLRRVLEMLMCENVSVEQVQEYIQQTKNKILECEHALLLHSDAISRPLDEYSRPLPRHVVAANQIMQASGKRVRPGDRIGFYLLGGGRVVAEELYDGREPLDYSVYLAEIDNTLAPVLELFLPAAPETKKKRAVVVTKGAKRPCRLADFL